MPNDWWSGDQIAPAPAQSSTANWWANDPEDKPSPQQAAPDHAIPANAWKSLPPAQTDALPDDRGIVARTGEAALAGLVGGGRDIAAAPAAFHGQAQPAAEPKDYQQPLGFSDLLHPSQAIPKIVYGLAGSWPELAAGIGAGAVGTVAGGPVAGLAAGSTAAGAVTAFKSIAPLFAEEMQKPGADPDHAFNVALGRATQAGAFSGAGWAVFPLGHVLGPIKHLLFQALVAQPGMAVGERELENVEQGKPVQQGIDEAALNSAVGTAVFMAGHAGIKALVPRPKPTRGDQQTDDSGAQPAADAPNSTLDAVRAAEAQQAARYPTPEAAAEAEIAGAPEAPAPQPATPQPPAPVSPELAARASEGSRPVEEAEADRARAGLAATAGIPVEAAIAPEAPQEHPFQEGEKLNPSAFPPDGTPVPLAPSPPPTPPGSKAQGRPAAAVLDESWVKDTGDVRDALNKTPLPKGWEIVPDPDSPTGWAVYDEKDNKVATAATLPDALREARRAAAEAQPATPPGSEALERPPASEATAAPVPEAPPPTPRPSQALLPDIHPDDMARARRAIADLADPSLPAIRHETARGVVERFRGLYGDEAVRQALVAGPADEIPILPPILPREDSTAEESAGKPRPQISADFNEATEPPKPPAGPAAAPPEPVEKGAAAPTWRPAAILAELDARGAGDTAYRQAFSTFSKTPLRKGETWRQRLVDYVARGPGGEEAPAVPAPTGPTPEEIRAVRAAIANPKAPNSRGVIAKFRGDHGDAEWQKVLGEGAGEAAPTDKSAAHARAQAVADGWRALGDKHQAGVIERIIKKSRSGASVPLFEENLANMEARLRAAQEKAAKKASVEEPRTISPAERDALAERMRKVGEGWEALGQDGKAAAAFRVFHEKDIKSNDVSFPDFVAQAERHLEETRKAWLPNEDVAPPPATKPIRDRPVADLTDEEARQDYTALQGDLGADYGYAAAKRPAPGSDAAGKLYDRMNELLERLGYKPWQRTAAEAQSRHSMPAARHRQEVERAIAAGKPVPEHVLAEYREGAPKAPPPEPKPPRKWMVTVGKMGKKGVQRVGTFSVDGRSRAEADKAAQVGVQKWPAGSGHRVMSVEEIAGAQGERAPEPPRAAEQVVESAKEPPAGLTDKEKATLTELHQQLNAAQADLAKAKTKTQRGTALERIDGLKRRISSLQERDVPPAIERAVKEPAPKYEGTPAQQGRKAQAAAVAKIREAASGGQGLVERAKAYASHASSKVKREASANRFMQGAMDQARGEAKSHYVTGGMMPADYRAGVDFAKENPEAVKPVSVAVHTATGQQTNYRFAHPDEARATADRLERLPPRVFYQHPSATFEAARPRLAADVQALVSRIAPGAHQFSAPGLEYDHQPIHGAYTHDGLAHIIAWSLAAPDMLHTVSHEAIHYLRRAGFLRPEEWATLERAAHEQGWSERYQVDERWHDVSPEERTEEAIAERYAEWAVGRHDGADGLIGRVFNRLNALRQQVAAIARRVLGRDATPEDIFAQVESGKIGRREAANETPPTSAFQRPLVGPVKEHIVAAATDAKDWLSRTKDGFAHALFPMLSGSKPAQAFAARFANGLRASMFRFGQIDRALVKQFTPEQRAAMGRALDRQSVFEQQARNLPADQQDAARRAFDATREGVAGLPADQRAVVEALNRLSQATWERMRDAGLVKPDADGLPYYMPRQFVNAGTGSRVTALNPQGRNLNTAGPKRRGHLEWEETEAAGKAKLGDDAELVSDIRSLVHALSRNERAITGRNLVEAIRRYAPDAVQEGGQPGGGYHTLDHPSMWRWTPDIERGADGKWHEATRPVVDEDGNPVLDEHGQPQTEPVFKRVPIHIHEDFRGPLNAVLSHETPDWYRSLMAVKGGVMHAIMFSPYIHFMVEMGRALPIAPGKVITGRILSDGQRFIGAKTGTPEAEWLNKQIALGGLSPIGQGWHLDPATIAEQARAPERSRIPGVDWFKNWHQTALWDRVFKLQVGLARGMFDDAIARGLPEDAAHVVAAHIANRYAGALPPENLSRAANMLANVALFSRSFTLGNLGVIKDMTNGAPSHTRALIEQMAGPEAAQDAQTMLRRKAVAAFTRDIALYLVGYGVLQSAVGTIRNMLDGEGPGDALTHMAREYLGHVSYALGHVTDDPTNLVGVLPQMWNEPGKKGRMFLGEEKGGKGIYARLPPGKVGEEFLGWFTHPGTMALDKLSPLVRPFFELMNNRDSLDRQIMRPNPQSLGDLLMCAGQAAGHILASQLPVGAIQGAANLVGEAVHPTMTGQQLAIEAAKLIGPATGVTQISGGHLLGPRAGYEAAAMREHEYDKQQAIPEARRMIQAGDADGARAVMERAGMAPNEIVGVIRSAIAPERGQARKERTFGRLAGDAGRERAGLTTGATQ